MATIDRASWSDYADINDELLRIVASTEEDREFDVDVYYEDDLLYGNCPIQTDSSSQDWYVKVSGDEGNIVIIRFTADEIEGW